MQKYICPKCGKVYENFDVNQRFCIECGESIKLDKNNNYDNDQIKVYSFYDADTNNNWILNLDKTSYTYNPAKLAHRIENIKYFLQLSAVEFLITKKNKQIVIPVK